MTEDTALKMAIFAMMKVRTDKSDPAFTYKSVLEAIEVLRAALAQHDVPETDFGETEPVAWMRPKFMIDDGWDEFGFTKSSDDDVPLYTAPPQREWLWLTDEEIDKTYETQIWDARRSYARAIEAKLKEKNT